MFIRCSVYRLDLLFWRVKRGAAEVDQDNASVRSQSASGESVHGDEDIVKHVEGGGDVDAARKGEGVDDKDSGATGGIMSMFVWKKKPTPQSTATVGVAAVTSPGKPLEVNNAPAVLPPSPTIPPMTETATASKASLGKDLPTASLPPPPDYQSPVVVNVQPGVEKIQIPQILNSIFAMLQ